ncbi:hypothetical protein BH23CHL8_BH23CHL8_04750 [soil metagenome]
MGIEGYLDYLNVLRNLNVPQGVSENRDLGGVALALGASGEVVTLARGRQRGHRQPGRAAEPAP